MEEKILIKSGGYIMIKIPNDYIVPLIRILEWHLKTYAPEEAFDTRAKRILEKLYRSSTLDGDVNIEKNEIYYIHTCISDATNNIVACDIDKDLVRDIHNWSFSEYRKSK